MKMLRAGMWLILGAVVVLGLSVAPANAALYNGHDYEVISAAEIDWQSAASAANSAGWYLATITDANENAFIQTLLTIGDREQYWLGGILEASGWAWDNGELWNPLYEPWGEGQPDDWENAPQYFLAFDSDQGTWGWDDNYSYLGLIQGYIIERVSENSVSPVPEPSTLLLLGSGLLGLVGYGRRRMKK